MACRATRVAARARSLGHATHETFRKMRRHMIYALLATKLKALYKAIPPPAARPIGRNQVREGLRNLRAMSVVYRPWHAAIKAREEALWKTLTLARYPRTMGIVREQGLPRSWQQLFW